MALWAPTSPPSAPRPPCNRWVGKRVKVVTIVIIVAELKRAQVATFEKSFPMISYLWSFELVCGIY